MFFRTGYNYDMDAVSLENVVNTGDDTPTIQSAKDESDINTIVARFGITGSFDRNAVGALGFGDFTDITDFSDALNCVNESTEKFMALPAEFRFKFLNDPQQFLLYCEQRDSKGERVHIEEMRKFGLAPPLPVEPPVPAPVRVEVVNPAAPKA